MEAKQLIVSIRIGNNTTCEFYALKRIGKNEDYVSYLRVEENGEYMCTHGAVCVNYKTNKIAISYDIFNVTADILNIKRNGDNVMFVVATDMFKADIFVAERNEFCKKGEDMFNE